MFLREKKSGYFLYSLGKVNIITEEDISFDILERNLECKNKYLKYRKR